MENDKPGNTRGYNTQDYYKRNRNLANDRTNFPDGENDQTNTQFDNLSSGKYENYGGQGYYGSNYGTVSQWNRGRDVEQNAGYRQQYNELTTGQWPEIEDAAKRRGISVAEIPAMSWKNFRGKGPRTYQRSDARILDDIHDRLVEDPYVDGTDIEVDVKLGEVTLTGFVDHRNVKRRV